MMVVSDLCAAYGSVPVLAGVSLRVEAETFVGILGHNGMGKTTLLKTLMGLLPATSGTVSFEGRDVTHLRPEERARRGIGYVPQGRQIFPALSVLDNLRMGALLAPGKETDAIDGILVEFPRLTPLLDRLGGALSGGEQQLLALARCLCAAPRLVLLDEPTEGIQPSIIDEMIETLSALQRSRNLTIILVEQNLKFISRLSQRVLIIQKGRISLEVDPAIVLDPAQIAEFVGLTA
jgi:branched-chain amino acid transport system ATP-binding protein